MPSLQSPPERRPRKSVLEAGLGLIDSPGNEGLFTASNAPATQMVQAVAVGLLAGDVVTGVAVKHAGGASGLTLARVGLYSAAGGLLAQSADVKATFAGSAATSGLAFSAPYTILQDDLYFLAVLQVGTTPAALFRLGANTSRSFAGYPLAAWQQASQADLPAVATPAASSLYWMAAY